MNKTKRLELISELKYIRRVATMESSVFHIGREEMFPFGVDVTKLVQVSTRLWRESWIIGPLDEIIADLEKEQ